MNGACQEVGNDEMKDHLAHFGHGDLEGGEWAWLPKFVSDLPGWCLHLVTRLTHGHDPHIYFIHF